MAACRSTSERKTPRRRRREVEGPARVPGQPPLHLRVFVGGVVVEDGVDHQSFRHRGLDGIGKADELLMLLALLAAGDDRAVEHVEGGERRRRAVADIVVGHGARLAGLMGSPGCDRANARIRLFSSTESTAACRGGST